MSTEKVLGEGPVLTRGVCASTPPMFFFWALIVHYLEKAFPRVSYFLRAPSENRTLHASCTGFEAVLFTVHNTTVAHQSSKPPATTLPSLGFPSVYHSEVVHPAKPRTTLNEQPLLLVSNRGIPPMQRSAVVGVVLGAVVSNLALLPGGQERSSARW